MSRDNFIPRAVQLQRLRSNEFVEEPIDRTPDGRPLTVSVRVLRVRNEEILMGDLVRFLKQQLRTHLTQQGVIQWEMVEGWLGVQNRDTGASHLHENRMRISGITVEHLTNVMEMLQESNQELDLETLVVSFQIYLEIVASGRTVKPSWWPKLSKTMSKWNILWDTPDDVNCIAYSLQYLMQRSKRGKAATKYFREDDKQGKRKEAAIRSGIRDSKALMKELGWGKIVDLERISDFIKIYSEFEVVVLTEAGLKSSPLKVFTGEDFKIVDEENDVRNMKRLYLFYECLKAHMVGVPAVTSIVNGFFGKRTDSGKYKWCVQCHYAIHEDYVHNHDSEDEKLERKKYASSKPCHKCNVVGEHNCPLVQCISCMAIYGKNLPGQEKSVHRCILWVNERKEEHNRWLQPGEPIDGTHRALLAYDFESRIVKKRIEPQREMITSFKRDSDGQYVPNEDGTFVDGWSFEYDTHKVNFVVVRDVFSGKEKIFDESDGIDPLEKFIFYVKSYNRGKNTLVAHNAKGYDSRLLLHFVYKVYGRISRHVEVIKRGQMIMQLKLGYKSSPNKSIFLDSLCHLPGSLKKLAKDYCPGELAKGYFPHMFNTPENYGYVGDLPSKETFDIYFSARSKGDVEEFDKWWEKRNLEGPWNFMEEMIKYNKNDVYVLARIMKIYHEQSMKDFGMTPWVNMTGPSFRHEVSIRQLSLKLDDEFGLSKLKTENRQGYIDMIQDLSKKYWAVLKPVEYAPVRAALRGGRTECFSMYTKLTEEEIAAGVRYRHVDITSSYPFQQIKHKYPVGLPELIIYDEKYAPCTHENCRQDSNRLKCDHPPSRRKPNDHPYVKKYGEQPTAEDILNEDWHGYVCVTLQPCKMDVMAIGVFVEELKKNLYSATRIVEVFLPTPTLKNALKWGYKLVKVHSFHKYKVAESLFREDTLSLFIHKTLCSGKEPQDLEAFAKKYDDKFDVDFGDLFRESGGKWEKRMAERQFYKIMLNCGWGKHAENPHQGQTMVLDEKTDNLRMNALVRDSTNDMVKLKSISTVGLGLREWGFEYNTKKKQPNLHNGYLPAAAWVPAFGQLQLWEQMNEQYILCTSNPNTYSHSFVPKAQASTHYAN